MVDTTAHAASACPPQASMRRIELLGQHFDVGSAALVLGQLSQMATAADGRSRVVLHANLHSLYTRANDARLQRAMTHAHGVVLFEGIALKLARFATHGEWCHDVNGTDLVPAFVRAWNKPRALRIALVGGAPGVATVAAAMLVRQQPRVEVVVAADGYGDVAVGAPLHATIVAARPDVVLLGLGTPLQETTALAWQQAATAPLLWCVGGLFDYWAGTRTRAPRVVRACRLEWLWRLVLHPGAMWRRTLVEGPWLLARIRRERV